MHGRATATHILAAPLLPDALMTRVQLLHSGQLAGCAAAGVAVRCCWDKPPRRCCNLTDHPVPLVAAPLPTAMVSMHFSSVVIDDL